MILTVCMSPCTDVTIELDAFNVGKTNQVKSKSFSFGGKALNVAIGVKRLGGESYSTGLLYNENGYIFVIEEGGHSDFAYGYQKVSKLYKTQDGGKTWTPMDCSNTPYTDLKNCLILAKFVTKEIGIIAGRFYYDNFDFNTRAFLTKDGGKTWTPIDISNYSFFLAS